MNDVVWLEHDFAPVPVAEPVGWMHVGTFLDTDVFAPTHLDTVDPLRSVSDSATGDSATAGYPPAAGSPARAIDQRKAELLEELVDLLVANPSHWHSFLLGHKRRHRVDRLADLPVEVLYLVVNQAITLHGARGGK